MQQLAAVLRIKPLCRLRCCALVVCGYGEGGREALKWHEAGEYCGAASRRPSKLNRTSPRF